mmetsp:Transcript_9625/g.22205  ORF Transcript_9625/g.22205 Transcript_9625/m.22205 type:complete len:279 (-) Transcript_9625:451-1287(-)
MCTRNTNHVVLKPHVESIAILWLLLHCCVLRWSLVRFSQIALALQRMLVHRPSPVVDHGVHHRVRIYLSEHEAWVNSSEEGSVCQRLDHAPEASVAVDIVCYAAVFEVLERVVVSRKVGVDIVFLQQWLHRVDQGRRAAVLSAREHWVVPENNEPVCRRPCERLLKPLELFHFGMHPPRRPPVEVVQRLRSQHSLFYLLPQNLPRVARVEDDGVDEDKLDRGAGVADGPRGGPVVVGQDPSSVDRKVRKVDLRLSVAVMIMVAQACKPRGLQRRLVEA